jgi:hypothetical protein
MTDDDIHARQEQAQIRILEILREFEPHHALVILAAACASTLMRMGDQARKHFKRDFPIVVARFLDMPHEVKRDQ